MFRSGIRKGEEIQLYIPSSRMRKLVEKWMAGEYDNPETESKPFEKDF